MDRYQILLAEDPPMMHEKIASLLSKNYDVLRAAESTNAEVYSRA